MWQVDENIEQSENNKISVEWFKHTLSKAIAEIDSMFATYRISEAFMRIYKLFWDDFSGWYLEMVKPAYQQPIDKATMDVTRHYFDLLMRLVHPFMPFVTEEIWQDIAPRKAGETIMFAPMPKAEEVDEQMLARFALVVEAITGVRNVRKQKNIPQKQALTLNVIADENYPAEMAAVIMKMCNLEQIGIITEKDPTADAFIVKTTQYFVPMGDSIDKEAEMKKLQDELAYLEGFLASVMKKLSNERFVSSAPEKVVANERAKQSDAEAKIAAIKERMEALR
jgi:valyl-tRNA synthetase